jgi:hypothetical protein
MRILSKDSRPEDRLGNALRFGSLLTVTVAGTIAAAVWNSSVIGQTVATTSGRVPTSPLNPAKPKTYQEVLTFGLQAKLPSEVAFVNSVVTAVQSGELPPVLVDQTYFWARTRVGNSFYGRATRPIIYFIPALEARVKKLHLNVEFQGGLP